jgi:hypothetical protein
MTLRYKPDFEAAKVAWGHYWAREAWRRPLVVCTVPKAGTPAPPAGPEGLHYRRPVERRWEEHIAAAEAVMDSREYLAETMPFISPDFGPDQFGAFLSGGTLNFSEGSGGTNWLEPVVASWEGFEAKIATDGPVWKGVLGYAKFLAQAARGKFLVGVCDLHSNLDALSALRGPENLCMDILDCPELLDRAMAGVRRLYAPVYEAIREASGITGETGSVGWIPFWCAGRYAVIQCDFMCMVGPEAFNRFVRPALEEEAAYLDHCILHLDGPGALRHLDGILAINDIDAIQWVPGDGQRPMHEWLDVLKRIQAAGKGLQIYGVTPEQVKVLHRELSPAGVVYCVEATDKSEAEGLLKWLELNM